jgi:lipid II isoglutaminyl synthase (glutamine-hydrolysing)
MRIGRRAGLLPLPAIVLLAKGAGWASRLLGKGRGTSVPGVVAATLDPQILCRLVARLSDGVVVVTGTNGKTTTSHLLRASLRTHASAIAANESGSNLAQGVITALVENCDLRGRPVAAMAVLEVDEAALVRIATQLSPRMLVVLNLFRDQLDRHAELDQVAAQIGAAIAATGCDVLLNADDARVAALAGYARGRVTYFGVDNQFGPVLSPTGDVSACPSCGGGLSYKWVSYAHLGDYSCTACGLRRPEAEVALNRAQVTRGEWELWARAGVYYVTAKTTLRGTYNLYNLVAALAVAHLLDIPAQPAIEAAAACVAVRGRGAAVEVGAGEVVVLLGKNPTAMAQALSTFICAEPTAPLLLVLNDAAADGRDVSWIWDTPLERLAGHRGPLLVAGSRRDSMLVRLHYAEVPARGCASLESAVDELVSLIQAGGRAFVLTTYSAVQSVDDHLSRLRDRRADVSVAA